VNLPGTVLRNEGLVLGLRTEIVPRATRRLATPERARIKTEEALNWYERHMAEDPSVDEIAHAQLRCLPAPDEPGGLEGWRALAPRRGRATGNRTADKRDFGIVFGRATRREVASHNLLRLFLFLLQQLMPAILPL
jgi:hypothetical protein